MSKIIDFPKLIRMEYIITQYIHHIPFAIRKETMQLSSPYETFLTMN